MDKAVDIYNEYVYEYLSDKLYPGEHIVIGKFEKEWANFKMLDIGIGAGRTTHHFAPLAKNYTGIDYAKKMLEHCQKIILDKHNATLLHCDARDLSRFYDDKFDFVMFSMGGIDTFNHIERINILNEIKKYSLKRVISFSQHTQHALSKTQNPIPNLNGFHPQDP